MFFANEQCTLGMTITKVFKFFGMSGRDGHFFGIWVFSRKTMNSLSRVFHFLTFLKRVGISDCSLFR